LSIIAPCKDCTKRHESCHSTCEDYKNWKTELDIQKRNVSRLRSLEQEKTQTAIAGVRRMTRKKY